MKKVNVAFSGPREDLEERVFSFPHGIIGFSEAKRFGLIYQGYGDVACLQCIDHIKPALLVTPWDTARLGPAPGCECFSGVTDNNMRATDLLWLLVLNPHVDEGWVVANIRAPIAIDGQRAQGMQVILPDEKLPLRMKWLELPDKGN